MKKQILLYLAFLIFALTLHAQVSIIPKPNELKINTGNCSLKKGVNFKVIRGDEPTKMLQKQVIDYLAFRNIPNSNSASTVLSINLLQNKPGDTVITDAYTLSITPSNIAIVSRTNSGLFYGLQSLYQLINSDTFNVVPCLEIKDQPALAYRGFQLDVCQHFFGIDVIKKYLDAISKLKFNQFVWKLADEQYFRIELKSNPKLTETENESETDNEEAKQFYTQEEIKQVVQYARERFINVIPEINFAQITAADDTSFQSKKNMLDEVFALFPSKYFNISNPIFVSDEIEDYIRASGRKMISIDDEFTKANIVLSYKNTGIGISASKRGTEVIMAPRNFCALDNYQDWDDSKLSKTMLYLPLDKIYKFNATDKAKQNILGSQANVDTKFIDNENKLTLQVYPRIFALAECFWTQKNKRKSFKDFSLRLEKIGYPGQITEKINLVKFK
jgi:hexosaminidase